MSVLCRYTFAVSDTAANIRRLEAENARLRRELDERSGKLHAILDHMPAMIGYWDRDQRNRFSNHAYLAWFGIDPERIPGLHIREVIGEERYRLNLPYIEAALRGEPQEFERAIPSPDGSRVRHSLANYIPDIVDGVVQGFYVMVSDITATKEVEARLNLSEERYRAVVDDQTEVISRFRHDGSYIFANEVYCRFFGKTEADLVGGRWAPVCYPDDLPRVLAQLERLSVTHPVEVIENRVYSGTGELHWMQFVNRGFFDTEGNLTEIQSVGRDITDRKKAELALQEAHELLEQRVIERTEQLRRLAVETTLAEERERQAIARDLHDSLGQLLHITRIKLDALGEHIPDPAAGPLREAGQFLADASRLVRSLTSQLSPPVLKRLGLAAALRWLGEEMQSQYGLQVDFSGGTLSLPLSPAQSDILFRATRELLINVAKHSGQHRARIRLEQVDDQLRLMVEDDGIGIADIPDALGRMRGFGLAAIRERLTYLGGETRIERAPAGGLRVSLHLIPATQSEPPTSNER